MNYPKVVEKYYSVQELAGLWGFDGRKIRDIVKAGDFVLRDETGREVSWPIEIGGEIRIPASAINAYAARQRYQYDPGIAARNLGELRRKMAAKQQEEAA